MLKRSKMPIRSIISLCSPAEKQRITNSYSAICRSHTHTTLITTENWDGGGLEGDKCTCGHWQSFRPVTSYHILMLASWIRMWKGEYNEQPIVMSVFTATDQGWIPTPFSPPTVLLSDCQTSAPQSRMLQICAENISKWKPCSIHSTDYGRVTWHVMILTSLDTCLKSTELRWDRIQFTEPCCTGV